MERLAALRAQIAELEADSDDSDLSEVDLGKK